MRPRYSVFSVMPILKPLKSVTLARIAGKKTQCKQTILSVIGTDIPHAVALAMNTKRPKGGRPIRFGIRQTGHNNSKASNERDTMIGTAPVTAWDIRNLTREEKRRAIWIAARTGQDVHMGYDNDTFGHSARIGK
jgi:hypothetical protein